MRVLIACECSEIIKAAYLKRGYDAHSCDLKPGDQGLPNHHQCDVREILQDGWDLMIAHPDCTYLSNSGVWALYKEPGRWQKMTEAAQFFKFLLSANIPHICIENPIIHRYAMEIIGQEYNQIVHPHQYGEPESKATCLWLKGLTPLVPTNILTKPPCGYWQNQTPSGQNKLGPSSHRKTDRARTYVGIAEAMADQWGKEVAHSSPT